MSESSQGQEPEHSDKEFVPKCFIIFCLDENNNTAIEASWGTTEKDIKNFAEMLMKINSGHFDKTIVSQLKSDSKKKNDLKAFSIFNKSYKISSNDLVIDPTNVELN